jgi:hypothetical protein
MAAGGLVLFVLKQKVPKNSSQQKCFFAARGFALQNGQNLGWDYFAPVHLAPLCKNSLCPAFVQPRIVLSVFARSCSADNLGKTKTFTKKQH